MKTVCRVKGANYNERKKAVDMLFEAYPKSTGKETKGGWIGISGCLSNRVRRVNYENRKRSEFCAYPLE